MYIGILARRQFRNAGMSRPRSHRWRGTLCGVALVLLLGWGNIASAAGSKITNITFTGTNAGLTIVISGSGFGSSPPGVPCKSCKTPYLQITGRIGCTDLYNIVSWKDDFITLNGLQANPGSNILVTVENPQNKTVGVFAKAVPKSIAIVSPTINSVAFGGSGETLRMTVTGTGFGATPPSLPAQTNLPFFVFIDRPFAPATWEAGYANCGFGDAVALNYVSWSDTKISIDGFGRSYGRGPRGSRKWTVASGDVVAIAAANSSTKGMALSYDLHFDNPVGNGTVWGGQLP